MLWPVHLARGLDFYPRSPCGERRYLINTYHRIFGISIHALLAESDLYTLTRCASQRLFLSTLSLRRATRLHPERYWQAGHFYPRSPCGERHHVHVYMGISMQISIHALLAESDLVRKIARSAFMIFLSTLSLRRATIVHFSTFRQSTAFLSTLSLRRATGCSCAVRAASAISIHALLAESDHGTWKL